MESQVSLTLPHCRGEVVRMRRMKEGREGAHGSDLGGRDGEVCESSLDGERGEESDGKESGVHRWATCKRVEQGAQAEGGIKGTGVAGERGEGVEGEMRRGEMKSKRGQSPRVRPGNHPRTNTPKHASRHALALIRPSLGLGRRPPAPHQATRPHANGAAPGDGVRPASPPSPAAHWRRVGLFQESRPRPFTSIQADNRRTAN